MNEPSFFFCKFLYLDFFHYFLPQGGRQENQAVDLNKARADAQVSSQSGRNQISVSMYSKLCNLLTWLYLGTGKLSIEWMDREGNLFIIIVSFSLTL